MNIHMVDSGFWKNKRVFLTGHTGFKGAWLSLWLTSMGARVWGYSLKSPTNPNLYDLLGLNKLLAGEWIGDIRDLDNVKRAVEIVKPEIVFHLAAQPLVRDSYKNPLETYSINVMGTANLLEAIRSCPTVRAVVNITTDKCYENREWHWGYRENEPLGGYDPYSSSKACSELVTSSYRSSFYNPSTYDQHGVAIASARAGNVIGGGDWAVDRLIPDCFRSLVNKEPILIRNPNSIRPWQHVLEPLGGYLLLGQRLVEDGPIFSEAWNFGPADQDARTVKWIVERICGMWDENTGYVIEKSEDKVHEATYLKLDCSKASAILGWRPRWSLEEALSKIVEWNHTLQLRPDEIFDFSIAQIEEYNLENIGGVSK
jgi:CDP-glucose 4,6-dehydratase